MPVGNPPTTEQGTSDLNLSSTGMIGALPWSAWIDLEEYAPDVKWPLSVSVYHQMQNDGQVKGLLAGTVLPIRRFRWYLDPNDAKPEVVAGLAKDLNLPVLGEEDNGPKPRRRNRFNFIDHLGDALRSLSYGHYYFEQVGEIQDDGLWHLRKLAPRPPRTIAEIDVAKDGGLIGIKQATGLASPPIPVSSLVAYVWDKEGANWVGRSMLRACFRNWIVKDRLIRVDAVNHERNGMGQPFAKAPQDASKEVMLALQEMASKLKAGEESGSVLPYGADMKLAGVEGSLPDTLSSLKYHDEQMARGFLMMFMDLAQAKFGSRSLGQEFISFFGYAQEAVADWFAGIFQSHVIEDWVDWNYGEQEDPVPQLGYNRNEGEDLATDTLGELVKDGVITMDPELEDAIRERHNLPKRPDDMPAAPPAPEPAQLPPGQPSPEALPQTQAGEGRRDDGGVQAASEVPTSPIPLPSRKLRRQPYAHEIAATTDFASLDANFNLTREQLVTEVKQLQRVQTQQLHDAIVAAKGNLSKLANLQADGVAEEAIFAAMQRLADNGVEQALGEAERQGVNTTRPSIDKIVGPLGARAKATDEVLARAISEAGARKSMALTGGSLEPAEVALQTKNYLDSLTGQYLRDQLGGTLNQAMNAGRKLVMQQHNAQRVYSSELLDENTCEPCGLIDGTEYEAMSDAEADYPTGGYSDCDGGPRCRGTLVAVYGEETG